MNVVLVHPIHGAKVAINEEEMKMDKKNGWVEYVAPDPVQPQNKPVKTKQPTSEVK